MRLAEVLRSPWPQLTVVYKLMKLSGALRLPHLCQVTREHDDEPERSEANCSTLEAL